MPAGELMSVWGSKQPKAHVNTTVNKCLQAAAARSGAIARLEQLFLESSCWWPETADAAFGAGQLQAFWWLLTYDPPCPWAFPTLEWVMDMPTRGRFEHPGRSRAKAIPEDVRRSLREQRIRLLMHTQECALACTLRPVRLVFDRLLVQMLDALHGACPAFPDMPAWFPTWKPGDCHGFMEYERKAMLPAVQRGLEGVVDWFVTCPVRPSWLSPSDMAAHAIEADQFSILDVIGATDPASSWHVRCGQAACERGQCHVLGWLRSHGYQHLLECVTFAAQKGYLDLLKWMRDQADPWPWDSSVCSAAVKHPAVLEWLRTCNPPCPWESQQAREHAAALVRHWDLGWLQRLNLPIKDMPEMCEEAARRGHLPLLRWLVRQQAPCPATTEVCMAALRNNDSQMVEFLVAEHDPPVFPQGRFRTNDACLLVLAQAGCHLEQHQAHQISWMVDSWYTLVGLQRWAAKLSAAVDDSLTASRLPAGCSHGHARTSAAHVSDGSSSSSSSSSLSEIEPPGSRAGQTNESPCAPDDLLENLAELPPALVDKIASHAFLSPKQASKIMSAPVPTQQSQASASWDSVRYPGVIGMPHGGLPAWLAQAYASMGQVTVMRRSDRPW